MGRGFGVAVANVVSSECGQVPGIRENSRRRQKNADREDDVRCHRGDVCFTRQFPREYPMLQ